MAINIIYYKQITPNIIKIRMKEPLQIIKQIAKNQTYESIRYNDHQISEDNIREAINKIFPKLLSQDKKQDIGFILRALKDELIFKNIQGLISSYLELLQKLQDLQIRQQDNSKFEDQNQKDLAIVEPTKKKITRASIAKRNQQTQEQLRKDQIYVRLTPKSQGCLQWMLCNRNFPRIQCKLSCNQHLEYLVNYLSNKWLRGKVGHKIILYPDMTAFLKNSPAQDRQKIIKQPLNNYFMFTDVMTGCGVGQNGCLNLNYEVTQIKKASSANKSSNLAMNTQSQKVDNGQITQKNISQNQNSHHDSFLMNINSSKKKPQQLKKSVHDSGNKHPKQNNNSALSNNFGVNPNHPSQQNLSNLSNLFPNKNNNNYYHQEESIFRSLGFFGLGNSLAFGNKNNDNILSVNSNSFFDLENNMQNFNKISQKQQQNQIQDKKQIIVIDEDKKQISQSGQKKINNNNQKLDYLRNAINLIQKQEGLAEKNQSLIADQQSQSQNKLMSAKLSNTKQVKTINIKKKNI